MVDTTCTVTLQNKRNVFSASLKVKQLSEKPATTFSTHIGPIKPPHTVTMLADN